MVCKSMVEWSRRRERPRRNFASKGSMMLNPGKEGWKHNLVQQMAIQRDNTQKDNRVFYGFLKLHLQPSRAATIPQSPKLGWMRLRRNLKYCPILKNKKWHLMPIYCKVRQNIGGGMHGLIFRHKEPLWIGNTLKWPLWISTIQKVLEDKRSWSLCTCNKETSLLQTMLLSLKN